MFGIALDPQFATNQTLYVHANRGNGCPHQLLRIVGTAAPVVLWSAPSGSGHNGGRLKFGSDGDLYLSGGDGDDPASATEPTDDRGKMWRFEGTGLATATTATATKVASGIRNSFGFDFDPDNGNLWFSDNGNLCNEEANLLVVGGNYAWGPNADCADSPAPENTNQDGPLPRQLPKWHYGPAQGATGVAFCDGCGLGAAIEGRLLYILYDLKQIQALTLDDARTGVVSDAPVFTHAVSSKPLSLERAPDGRVYFSDETAIYLLASTPDTTTFTPVDDARVSAGNPSTNYGSETTLKAKGGSSLNNSYLKFTVTGLAGPPASAKLRMKVTDGSVAGGSIRPVANTSWTEEAITYNNAPTTSSTLLSSTGAVSNGAVVEFDLGTHITGNGTYSLALTSANSSDSVSYSSKEGAGDPELVITPGTPSSASTASADGPSFSASSARAAATTAPMANFKAALTDPGPDQAVVFNDTSTGQPASWLWDFGDGTTSSAQHPTHAYAGPGTYTVTLTAANALGTDTATMEVGPIRGAGP